MRTNIYFVNSIPQNKKLVHIPAIFRNAKLKMLFWEKVYVFEFLGILWSILITFLGFACIRNSLRKKKDKFMLIANEWAGPYDFCYLKTWKG